MYRICYSMHKSSINYARLTVVEEEAIQAFGCQVTLFKEVSVKC